MPNFRLPIELADALDRIPNGPTRSHGSPLLSRRVRRHWCCVRSWPRTRTDRNSPNSSAHWRRGPSTTAGSRWRKCWQTCVVPKSKPVGHPEYDPRFEMMLTCLQTLRQDVDIEAPIVRTAACQSLHTGGQRSIAQALRTLSWHGFKCEQPDVMCFIDDVITCGTNFKACQRLLWQHCPEIAARGGSSGLALSGAQTKSLTGLSTMIRAHVGRS
jgi:hypothetical protein